MAHLKNQAGEDEQPLSIKRRWLSLHSTAIRGLDGGKRIGNSVYLHISLVELQISEARQLVRYGSSLAGLAAGDFTVVRMSCDRPEIALLDYPDFMEAPFPALRTSWLVDLATGKTGRRDFPDQNNAPILHRKELMLGERHSDRARFAGLTEALEDLGAFDDPLNLIGRRRYWERRLADLGLRLQDHTVVLENPAATDGRGQFLARGVVRHRTAIARSRLSAPMQALTRWGFIDGSLSILDYGCGRGDDVRVLKAAGVQASGWDPHFAPDEPVEPADVVNLGFVLNVIEDQGERAEVLRRAFALSKRLLSVAVMQPDGGRKGQGLEYADGIVTRRGTFQRYFGQAELFDYVSDILGREPVTVAPGTVFVFRADQDEQTFLAQRQRSAPRTVDRLLADTSRRVQKTGSVRGAQYEQHQQVLDAFWGVSLELGRLPEPDEFEQWDDIAAAFRTGRRAFGALPFPDKDAELARVAAHRSDDLLVYLALNLFENRRSAQALPKSIQRDIRCFFGSHKAAAERARNALFESGSPEHAAASIARASGLGLGVWARKDGDYTFHASVLKQQPALLRIILGCAERLEPIPARVDLLKVHGQGHRVSYLHFDDFARRPLPLLTWRLVVDLRHQRADVMPVDGPDGRRVLLGKASFMPPEAQGRDRQERFDEVLRRRGVLRQEGLGPGARTFARRMTEAGIGLRTRPTDAGVDSC